MEAKQRNGASYWPAAMIAVLSTIVGAGGLYYVLSARETERADRQKATEPSPEVKAGFRGHLFFSTGSGDCDSNLWNGSLDGAARSIQDNSVKKRYLGFQYAPGGATLSFAGGGILRTWFKKIDCIEANP